MRALLWGGLAAAIALSAGSTPAPAADIPGNSRTKAVITPGPTLFRGVLERRGDSDWYRVTLKAGRNYAIVANSYGCTRVNLRNAAGKVLRSSGPAWEEENNGFEFRSATTRTYFVEYLDANFAPCIDPVEGGYPTGYAGNVAMEVRGDTTTRATIAPGQTVDGLLNWVEDKDYFRATLDAGKGYTVSLDDGWPPEASLTVVDPGGKVVAGGDYYREPLPFKVLRTGTYYAVVAGTLSTYGWGSYKVRLSTP